MSHKAGNRILLGCLLLTFFYWVATRSVYFREKPHLSWFHSCPREWHGPSGPLQQYSLICTETGGTVGEVFHSDDGWYAMNASKQFQTLQQAKNAEEKAWRW